MQTQSSKSVAAVLIVVALAVAGCGGTSETHAARSPFTQAQATTAFEHTFASEVSGARGVQGSC